MNRPQISARLLTALGALVAIPPALVLILWLYEPLACLRLPYLAAFAGKTGRLGDGLDEFSCTTASVATGRLMIVATAVFTIAVGVLADALDGVSMGQRLAVSALQ